MEPQKSMSKRLKTVSRLVADQSAREIYVKATLNTLIPAQIRALRLRDGSTQKHLAQLSGMKQARISAAETPGAVNFSLETLVRIASAFRVGLQVRFLSYSQMLDWENDFSQDDFAVRKIEEDTNFAETKNNSVRFRPLTESERKALDPSSSTKTITITNLTLGEQDAPNFNSSGESTGIRGIRLAESERANLFTGFSTGSGREMPIRKVS
jgi:transcriptional regulator with XRE-family HTH domain